jgi:hypothetical protein
MIVFFGYVGKGLSAIAIKHVAGLNHGNSL